MHMHTFFFILWVFVCSFRDVGCGDVCLSLEWNGRRCNLPCGSWKNRRRCSSCSKTKVPDSCLKTFGFIILILGWSLFTFTAALTSSSRGLKHSSEVVFHINMLASHGCCRFVGCTLMMWIACSTTNQIRSKAGDCGVQYSELITFKKPVWDYLRFVTRRIIVQSFC